MSNKNPFNQCGLRILLKEDTKEKIDQAVKQREERGWKAIVVKYDDRTFNKYIAVMQHDSKENVELATV